MKKDRIIEYSLLLLIFIVTLLNLFWPDTKMQVKILTIFLLAFTIFLIKLMKYRKVDNPSKNKVIIFMIGLSTIYIILLYIIGIFAGFYKNANKFSYNNLYNIILPYIIIIVCSEIIRQIFVTKENKKITIITTIVLVLIEITLYLDRYKVWNLDNALILIGYVTFPAISINLMCNYMVRRYGIIPNILYRVIITIYMYIFSVLPDIYMFFQSIYKIIYPYIIYVLIDEVFEKKRLRKVSKHEKISLISILLSIIIIISIVMLVSCKFKYGILVVGSSSMTGTVDKGDAVIFERYDNQNLKKGQIIVFTKDNIKTIHCIENIQIKNDETIYFTKGTNNQQRDEGYRTDSDILGIVKFKIIDIGWPTIWLNDIFTK